MEEEVGRGGAAGGEGGCEMMLDGDNMLSRKRGDEEEDDADDNDNEEEEKEDEGEDETASEDLEVCMQRGSEGK